MWESSPNRSSQCCEDLSSLFTADRSHPSGPPSSTPSPYRSLYIPISSQLASLICSLQTAVCVIMFVCTDCATVWCERGDVCMHWHGSSECMSFGQRPFKCNVFWCGLHYIQYKPTERVEDEQNIEFLEKPLRSYSLCLDTADLTVYSESGRLSNEWLSKQLYCMRMI